MQCLESRGGLALLFWGGVMALKGPVGHLATRARPPLLQRERLSILLRWPNNDGPKEFKMHTGDKKEASG